MKVLIAVASERLADLLASSLSLHTIHICHTGSDTLDQIQAFRPDVLLLELMLPGMDGLTVLRNSDYKPRMILALTNLASPGVLAEAAVAGVQDILLIPCSVRHILEHLNALMRKTLSPEG